MRIKTLVILICLGFLSGTANAATITLSGYFDDSGNTALVGSDLGAALFGYDYEIANNVALYTLSIPVAGEVRFISRGNTGEGADPYFTLFMGSDHTATFLGSNNEQAFSTGGDFNLTYDLGVGDYRVAMGVFANMSLAENYGSGTLGDGFTGLGVPDWLGNYYYELEVTMPDQVPVPEPGTLLLTLLGLTGLAGLRKIA